MKTAQTSISTGFFLLLLLGVAELHAQQKNAEFQPAAEATVYADFPDGNGGGYDRICIGNDKGQKLRRGYINYDLSDIPRGSTIRRVILNLFQYRIRFQGPGAPFDATMLLHRLDSHWEEGEGLAEDPTPNGGRPFVSDECGVPLTNPEGVLTWNNVPDEQEHKSLEFHLPKELSWDAVIDTDEGSEYDGLIDDVQHWVNSGNSHGWRVSVERETRLDNARVLTPGVLFVEWDESTASAFAINPGLNDAWYNKATDGQGIFIIVYPDIRLVFLAWFTYEADAPDGAVPTLNAVLGDDEHRWLTASGFYEEGDDRVLLDISVTRGGKFDAGDPVERENDGTIELIFEHCDKALVKYQIPSIDRTGEVEVERVAKDNVALCEALIQ